MNVENYGLCFFFCRFVIGFYKKPSITHKLVQHVVENTDELMRSTVAAIDGSISKLVKALPMEVCQSNNMKTMLGQMRRTIHRAENLFQGMWIPPCTEHFSLNLASLSTLQGST